MVHDILAGGRRPYQPRSGDRPDPERLRAAAAALAGTDVGLSIFLAAAAWWADQDPCEVCGHRSYGCSTTDDGAVVCALDPTNGRAAVGVVG